MKPLSLGEFYALINSTVDEIGGTEFVNSHSARKPTLSIRSVDPDDDNDYEIVGVDPDLSLGCGCWQGVDILIRKKQ